MLTGTYHAVPAPDLAAAVTMARRLAAAFAARIPAALRPDREDLESEAVYAVLRAARSWDPAGGKRFTSWAYQPVQLNLKRAVRDWSPLPRQAWEETFTGKRKPSAEELPPVLFEDQWMRPAPEAVESAWAERVARALGTLPARQAELLWRKHALEHTNAELCRWLDCCYSALRYRLKEAETAFREGWERSAGPLERG